MSRVKWYFQPELAPYHTIRFILILSILRQELIKGVLEFHFSCLNMTANIQKKV